MWKIQLNQIDKMMQRVRLQSLYCKVDSIARQIQSDQGVFGKMQVLNALQLIIREVETLNPGVLLQDLADDLEWYRRNLLLLHLLLSVGV